MSVNRPEFCSVALYIVNKLPVRYVPGRLDKYQKLSVTSGIAVRVDYLLMTPPRRRITIELLLGISAIFLSLAALVVSIFQTKIAREQQQASVWPYLQVVAANYDRELHYGLENKGVGPAIIKEYKLSYKGKAYPSIKPLFWEQIGVNTPGGKGFAEVETGDVFKSGEDFEILFVSRSDSIIQKASKMLSDTSFRLRIRYADVYGNCWQLDRNKVTAIGKCPEP